MKICFFSDIHGNGPAFHQFTKILNDVDADIFVFGGDVFGYYYDGIEILEWLEDNPHIKCIVGNHDKMVIDAFYNPSRRDGLVKRYGCSYRYLWDEIKNCHIEILKKWNPFIEISCNDKCIGIFHGGPHDPTNERIYPDTIFADNMGFKKYTHIISGHTHHRMDSTLCGCRFMNPGSIGQQRDGKGCSFLIFDTIIDVLEIKSFQYNVDILVKQIHDLETDICMHDKLIEVLYRDANNCHP